MNLSTKIKLSLLLILIVILGYALHQCNKPQTVIANKKQIQQLAPDDRELIHYNETNHTVTITTKQGTTTTEYSRNPTVHIENNEAVKVDRHDYGFETEPYVGFGIHDRPRIELGASLFYYNRWDLGVGIAASTNSNLSVNEWIRGEAMISYNVYSNTNLFVGVDTSKTVNGGIFFRF